MNRFPLSPLFSRSIAMPNVSARPVPTGLLACGLGAAALASAVSAVLVFGAGPEEPADVGLALAQAGPIGRLVAYVVAFVWVGLFAALGIAFWYVTQARRPFGAAGWAILALTAHCAVYPLYMVGVTSPEIAIAGNVATMLGASFAAGLAWPRSRVAALLVLSVVAWIALATWGLLAVLAGNPF